jgi:nucleoside-diphosphate-sugar epimerase
VSNFIVAGGHGFIGSQLVTGLRNVGCEVIILNIFSQSSIDDAVASISLRPHSEWILINCSSPNEIRIKSEVVLGVDSLQPIYRIFDFMKSARLTRLIHFSTIQLFGTNLEGEVKIESPLRIETPYAKVHFEIESYIERNFKNAGITSIVLRLSNVFGANPESFSKRITLVPNCFVDELLTQSKITLLTSGKQLRNFLSIAQLIDEIVFISRNGFAKSYTDICASDFYLTILDAAKICIRQYSNIFNKIGDLKISSAHPVETTRFKLVSQYSDPRGRNINSEKEFELVVSKLFDDEAIKRGLV